jgi:hypothetical protein
MVIQLHAIPNSGFRFERWETTHGGLFSNSGSPNTTFVMPNSMTTVTAFFSRIEDTSSLLSPPPAVTPPTLLPDLPAILSDPFYDEPYTDDFYETGLPSLSWHGVELRSVSLNTRRLNLIQAPIHAFGNTFIPVREIFQALGFTVTWDESQGAAIIRNGNGFVQLIITPGSEYFDKNGFLYRASAPAQFENGTLMMPFTEVLDSIGCTAFRDENDNLQLHYR